MPDIVGLNIPGPDDDNEAPACPDCGGPMEPLFNVECDDPEVARRVFASYQALKRLPMEAVEALLPGGGHHVHIHPDEACKTEHEKHQKKDDDAAPDAPASGA